MWDIVINKASFWSFIFFMTLLDNNVDLKENIKELLDFQLQELFNYIGKIMT